MPVARDIITPAVISVQPEDHINDAMDLLVANRISGLPVIEENGKLVGIISEADRLKLFKEGTDLKKARVCDYMTSEVITVDEDTSLEEIADRLTTAGIRRVPVLHDSDVVGIISRRDMLLTLSINQRRPG